MATGDSKCKLSKSQYADIQKFVKYLSLKSVQIIVQSRLGIKTKTKSKPNSIGEDWFNLAIDDNPEILAESKKAMGNRIPSPNLSLCIEISLKNVEGIRLVLEIWKLYVSDQCIKNNSHNEYIRMGLLLKSLMCITKTTPAFKFSCLQGAESYIILYSIFMGEPDYSVLGEKAEHFFVGQVATPLGGVGIALAYRTELSIDPQPITPLLVTSNYFDNQSSKILANDDQNIEQDQNKNASSCEEVQDGVANVKMEKLNATFIKSDYETSDIWENKVGAFVPSAKPPNLDECLIPETPFHHLLQPSTTSMHSFDENNNAGTENASPKIDEQLKNASDSDSDNSNFEDFVIVELKPPFAEAGYSSLGTFFKDLPPLQSLNQDLSLEEQVSEINSQLEHLESNCAILDNFVDSLCQLEENS